MDQEMDQHTTIWDEHPFTTYFGVNKRVPGFWLMELGCKATPATWKDAWQLRYFMVHPGSWGSITLDLHVATWWRTHCKNAWERNPSRKQHRSISLLPGRRSSTSSRRRTHGWAMTHGKDPPRTPKQQVASQSSQPPTTAQLASIEANIEKRILAAVQSKATQPDADVNMDTDQLESRVTQLEKQIQQVHANQVGLDTKVNQMQCQLEQQSKQFNASLDQKLASQMDKIEALFSKGADTSDWPNPLIMALGCIRTDRSKPLRSHLQDCDNIHLRQSQWYPACHRSLCLLISVFAITMRIGEATTPGPALGPVLGNINPTGLMGKSNDVAQLPVGVYAVQETHLTGPGITKFRQELAWRKSQYNLCHGAPAPPKNSSLRTIGGKHTGVGFLSSFSCRSITNEWSPEDFQTGRCLAAAAYVQSRWINLGTVYGYGENRQAVQVQQNTGRLLEGLTKRIVDGATGLRMISGDWNLPREQIPQADYWEAKGWMEAQQLAAIKWNRPAQATCKRTTVRDYVYLSPEVIPYVIDVQLDWSYFTDHAVIQVHLSDLAKPPKMPMWRKPAPLPWPKLEQQPEWNKHAQPSHDMDQWYKSVWKIWRSMPRIFIKRRASQHFSPDSWVVPPQ